MGQPSPPAFASQLEHFEVGAERQLSPPAVAGQLEEVKVGVDGPSPPVGAGQLAQQDQLEQQVDKGCYSFWQGGDFVNTFSNVKDG